MIHHMHLSQTPFERIVSGKQTIEARVCDEKRQLLSVGDKIEFSLRGDLSKKFNVTIIELIHQKSFKGLYSSDVPEKFGGKDLESLLDAIYEYYSKDDEEKWGVVGIRVMLLD